MTEYVLETITKLVDNTLTFPSPVSDWVPLLSHIHNERLQM